MKPLYICHTVYHLLITLAKHDVDEPVDVLLFDKIPQREALLERLAVYKDMFVYLSEEHVGDYADIPFQRYHTIHVYNDWTRIGTYLREKKIAYHLIEDGYNYYQFDHIRQHFSWRGRLLCSLPFLAFNQPFGYSRYVKSIEVNDMKMVIKDWRYPKMIEQSRFTLFQNLSKGHQQRLKTIFAVDDITIVPNGILILTQPLYQDRWDSRIKSEEDQLAYYEKVVAEFPNRRIYFKIHPRDDLDYSSLASSYSVIFLSKHVPMEVYMLGSDLSFDLGITHSSTALDYLSCIREKRFLNLPNDTKRC